MELGMEEVAMRSKGSSGAGVERRARMPQPDTDQAEHQRQHRVAARFEPLAILGQIERLQAERRERRVAPANPEHEELAESGAGAIHRPSGPVAVANSPMTNEPETLMTKRSPGKGLTDPVGDEAGSSPPGQAAQTATDKNPQCIPHKSNPATTRGAGRSYQH